MKFVFFVEGHTEKEAISSFLKRWLDPRTPKKVAIKVVRFDGWPELVKDLHKKSNMYLDGPDRDNIIAVLSLLDLYGPTFYPGNRTTAKERLEWGTQHLEKMVARPRFHAFFAVHEFEAWLLSQPAVFPSRVQGAVKEITDVPETVNFEKPPCKRLADFYLSKLGRTYKKTANGTQLFKRLDPNVAAQKCPELKKMLEAMLKMVEDFR